MIDCNECRPEKRHECANMGKVKRLELWWQLYRTSLPVWDFRPMDFCWHECTSNTLYRNTVELHLSALIRTASHPVMQTIRKIEFSLKTGCIDSLNFGCYYFQLSTCGLDSLLFCSCCYASLSVLASIVRTMYLKGLYYVCVCTMSCLYYVLCVCTMFIIWQPNYLT